MASFLPLTALNTWSQNAFGETIGVRATLRQVFYRARRDALELKAQTQAAGRGLDGDVGGHIIGHELIAA